MELHFAEFKLPVSDTVLLNKIAYTGRHCLVRRTPVNMKPFLDVLRSNAAQTFEDEKECDRRYGKQSTITKNKKKEEKAELVEAIVNHNKRNLRDHTAGITSVREPFKVSLWGQDEYPDIRDVVWHKLCMLGLGLYLCPYGNIYVNPSCWHPGFITN
jgi:hypothetical protein